MENKPITKLTSTSVAIYRVERVCTKYKKHMFGQQFNLTYTTIHYTYKIKGRMFGAEMMKSADLRVRGKT